MISKRLLGVVIALAVVVLTGVCGYAAIEGWGLFDSLYMTVITIASVGYTEVHPLSGHGRMFTIVLILCGSATLIYGLSTLTAFIVEGELTDVIRRRKMKKTIAGLRGHYIVCGVSSTGRHIIDELLKTGRSLVVVDRDPERLKGLVEANVLTVEGDATHEAVLSSANVAGAAGLLAALHGDGENLLVVVTAKGLNPGLKVVAKASDNESERKLRQVGADRVVMPDFIGGLRMASELIRPSVVSFLDVMLRGTDAAVRVEEIPVQENSPLSGRSLAETALLEVEGVTVVAVVDTAGGYAFNPPCHRRLLPGEVVIVMGIVDKILGLKAQAAAEGQDIR